MKKIIAGAAICLALHAATWAAPSTMGSTGMIDTPTADTLREGQISLGYFDLEEGRDFTFGTNIGKNLELSFAGAKDDASDRKNYVNLKYALKPESVLLPGIAIGLEDIGDTTDRTAYIAVSKALPLGFRVHAGLGSGRYDGPFYAIEKSLFPAPVGGVFPDTALIVEHDGHAMNYGLRVSLAAGFKFNAGWRDDDPYFGVTYNLY